MMAVMMDQMVVAVLLDLVVILTMLKQPIQALVALLEVMAAQVMIQQEIQMVMEAIANPEKEVLLVKHFVYSKT